MPVPDTPNLSTQVKEALDALGKNAGEVAATLRRLRITGIPEVCASCPVARYLRSVTQKEIECDYKETWNGGSGEICSVPIPDPVRDFMFAFDHGGFRELKMWFLNPSPRPRGPKCLIS